MGCWASVEAEAKKKPRTRIPDLRPPSSDLRSETSILRLIGNTPLVPLLGFYAKLEMQNPGGSVKDRAAARIVTDAIASGKLTAGNALANVDAVRLLDRRAHHAWRAAAYLAGDATAAPGKNSPGDVP